MDSAQITGAASSYARKYALSGLFCIDDTKDADSTNDGKSSEVIDEKQYSQLLDYINDVGVTEAKLCAFLKVDKLTNLPKTQFQQAIAALEAKKKGAK
jgi:hypothetical protein